jgi:hypothetical protein
VEKFSVVALGDKLCDKPREDPGDKTGEDPGDFAIALVETFL